MYKSDGKVVKPSQINVLGFCPGNEDCDLPEGGGYVCRERSGPYGHGQLGMTDLDPLVITCLFVSC